MNKVKKKSNGKRWLFSVAMSIGLLASAHASADLDSTSYPQETLISRLERIQEISPVVIAYDAHMIGEVRVPHLSVNQADWASILKSSLASTMFTYRVLPDGSYVIVNRGVNPPQKISVKGMVVDEHGEPVIGASIVVKGTTQGVLTDVDGNFNIIVPSEAILQVSYIGYAQKNVPVKGQTSLQIVLIEDAYDLEEVVVTALGIKKETRRLGYAVQEIGEEKISEIPNSNIASTLSGKVAGLVVYNTPNFYRENPMLIRGRSPLIVIDGVPVNSNSYDINAMDVESINVLKGSTAAALYGSKGQNGAIQITTKKGKEGRTVVELSQRSMFRVGWIRSPKVQTQYGNGYNGQYAYKDGMGGGTYDDDWVWGPKLNVLDPSTPSGYWETTQWDSPRDENGNLIPIPWVSRGKDNLKNFLRTGYVLSNNVSVTTGSERGSMRASFGYDYNRGEVPNTSLHVFNASLSADYKLTERLSFSGTVLFNRQNSPNYPAVGYGTNNILYNLLIWAGTDIDITQFKDYWVKGQEGYQQNYFNKIWINNPYFMAYEKENSIYRNRTLATASLDYEIIPHLKATFRQSADVMSLVEEIKWPKSYIWYSRDRRGDYELSNINHDEFNTDFFLTYENTFGRFDINAFVGASINYWQDRYHYSTTQGLKVPGIYNLGNTIDPVKSSNSLTKYFRNSVFASVDLGWDNTYYLGITAREDISSALPESNNSYFYPSVSGSIVLSKLFHMPSSSFLKVRGSWSQVRSDLEPYEYMTTYQPGITYGQYNSMQYPSALGNMLLKPSLTNAYEFGVNGSFFNNRLSVDLTYFNAYDRDLISDQSASLSSGFSSYKVNGNKYQRTGGEIMLSGVPVKTADFEWTTGVNWSLYRNILREVYGGGDRLGSIKVGERTDKVMINKFMRSADGQLIIGSNGLPVKDQYLSSAGYSDPSCMLSWNNSFRILKDFTVSFLLDARIGGVIYGTMNEKMWYGGTHPDAVGELRDAAYRGEAFVAQGVNVTGGELLRDSDGNILSDTRTYQPNTAETNWITYMQYTNGNSTNKEFNMFSGSYLKLRELSITYEIPKRFLAFTKSITYASISLVGSNLFIISKYPFSDPDSGTDADLQYPSARNVGFNLNVKF